MIFHPQLYKDAPFSVRSDKQLCEQVFRKNGGLLRYAPEEIRKDKSLVTIAINSQPFALVYAADDLKDDDEMAFLAMTRRVKCFNFLSQRLRDNEYFILNALQNARNRGCFSNQVQYISRRLLDTKDFVMVIIQEYHIYEIYMYVSADLCNDRDIAEIAILYNHNRYFPYLSKQLQNDNEFLLDCATKRKPSECNHYNVLRFLLKHLNENIFDDETTTTMDKLVAVIDEDPRLFFYLPDFLQEDCNIVQTAQEGIIQYWDYFVGRNSSFRSDLLSQFDSAEEFLSCVLMSNNIKG